MEPILRATLFMFGISVIGISLAHIALGPGVVPGSIPVNATMDSEDRFYAVFFLAYGAAVLWCLRGWRAKLREIKVLMAIFFAGGLVRLISMTAAGYPHPFFVAMTVIEFMLPLFVVWLTAVAPTAGRQARGH